ncbi:ectonucleotide pyrophosphatase/phosphodiesterase family member 5-like [Anneissia japonica]|uniref:ectonucleotide pyrophosphatase/phosphodiesterase family member 5-like n=1 Tax=Anneissia japonica TaxID=1529436 RepID=UPI0014257D71|nr:ectonucleotide pyrophosphatase/phosphodiesterase family member 5-like [Anneissia japonica]
MMTVSRNCPVDSLGLGLALLLMIGLFCLTGLVTSAAATTDKRVLLVSLDGFRADYLDKTDMPNFRRLISDGVRAKFTYDAFITKTFPNHYTIVTGMYEETHGIVGNNMYDPLWNETFHIGEPSSLEPKWWSSGEPVWITNQNNLGQSAVINWPGSDIKIRDQYPTYYLPKYNESIPFSARVNWIIQHFKNENDHVNLGILYYHEPDRTGHRYGPSSPELIKKLQDLDVDVGYLIDEMKANGLYETTNIIITSDHGMADVSVDRVIELDNFVDASLYYFDSNNPILGIWPNDEGDTSKLYDALKNASKHMDVYWKDEIPKVFHYHDNRRIAPILLVANEGWSIFQNFTAAFPHMNDTKYFKGAHGYDNRLEVMHPIFVAHGPVFNKNQSEADPFYNVDIYPLICYILNIPESPNNGSFHRIFHILRKMPTGIPTTHSMSNAATTVPVSPTSGQDWPTLSISAIIALSVAFGVGFLAAVIFTAMCLKQRTYRQPPCNYKPIIDTSLDMYDDDMDVADVKIHQPVSPKEEVVITNCST